MRRESSTVVVLVGEVGEGLLDGLGRSPNVSVARAPAAGAGQPGEPTARPGWEAGALALREAADAACRRLAEMSGAADRWRSYLSRWTAWNHLRAAAALAATGLLTVALQLS